MIYRVIATLLVVFLFQGCQHEEEVQYSTIPMIPDGGIYRMPCEINGLPLKFIFDTGASDVSISKTEASFMLKNDFIQFEDLKDKVTYSMANGDIQEGVKLLLREVKIGDVVLNNVSATVIVNDNAPILLGQSVLSQLGIMIVDYSKNEMSFIKGDFNVGRVINPHNSSNELIEANTRLQEQTSEYESEKSTFSTTIDYQKEKIETLQNQIVRLQAQIARLQEAKSNKPEYSSTNSTDYHQPPSDNLNTDTLPAQNKGGSGSINVIPNQITKETNSKGVSSNYGGGFKVPSDYIKMTFVKGGKRKLYKSAQADNFWFNDVEKLDDVYILRYVNAEIVELMVRGRRVYMKRKYLVL